MTLIVRFPSYDVTKIEETLIFSLMSKQKMSDASLNLISSELYSSGLWVPSIAFTFTYSRIRHLSQCILRKPDTENFEKSLIL